MSTRYRIYGSPSADAPVDESTPLATGLAALTWDTLALTPGRWKFLVRAYDTASGLEEKNVDSLLAIDIDASGADVTGRPLPPTGLLVTPIAGGDLRVEWSHPYFTTTNPPLGYRVYVGTGGTPDYGTIATAVGYLGQRNYRATLSGLTPGTEYAVAVRAYNTAGEEENTVVVLATPTDLSPSNVAGLTSDVVP